MAELILTQHVYRDMIENAMASLPNEGCGYLAGKNGRASAFYPIINVKYGPDYFEMDQKEQQAAFAQMNVDGWSMLGIYHSHPQTPAHLTGEDVEWANDPTLAIVIVSLRELPNVKAYLIRKPLENHVEIEQLIVTVE